jgi:cystathionine beta-lyase/cystathionine gamma-synthase
LEVGKQAAAERRHLDAALAPAASCPAWHVVRDLRTLADRLERLDVADAHEVLMWMQMG